MLELIPLAGLAFLAGYADAVVGGGGLIQLPALFNAYPHEIPAALFGTNKAASICGTSAATARYAHGIRLPWRMLAPAAAGAFLFSFLGARLVSLLPMSAARPLVLGLLIAVGAYTWYQRDLGSIHGPRLRGAAERWLGFCVGAGLGFYDGFFGPGTGTFLVFLFVRVFGYDFLHASASAKVVNWTTNLAALAYFVPHGHVMWPAALAMGACNIAGSVTGSHMALKHGAGFVRKLFLGVVVLMIVKLAWDTFGG